MPCHSFVLRGIGLPRAANPRSIDRSFTPARGAIAPLAHDFAFRENLMATTDEDLIRKCATGDREAFEDFYDRFAPRVFGLLFKLIGRRDQAEDVLQEVMSEAWVRCSRFDPSLGSAATWVLMIARSRGIDAVRRKKGLNARMTSLAEGPARALATGDSPTPASAPPQPMLRAALSALPPEQQTVIEMAFYRGLTRDQIAETLNIPVGTVKTRIRLGIRRLSEQGGGMGPTDQ